MRRGQIALIGSLALAVLVVWALVAGLLLPALTGTAPPSAAAEATPAERSPTPVPTATSTATATDPGPTATAATADPPTADPPTTDPTDGADPTLDPRLAFAEFLLRLDAARVEVQDLNATLVAAAEDGDPATVRATAVDILQFADGERDWLLAHPPAACYADAHEAAGTMVEAYATVAERAIDWVDADPGLDALDALADVLAAAEVARDALGDLGRDLEAATCRD
jgi:hypothetical protein